MEVKAQAKFQRISPKKVRLVADVVRNMKVSEAQTQLGVSTKKAAPMVLKLLKSAIANAKNNNKLAEDSLFVTQSYVDEGPTLKRWKPRAFGRAAPIRKRTSHITIVVGDKPAQGGSASGGKDSKTVKSTNNTKKQTK
jgi:large subunit ribosomal protein L22